MKKQNQYLGYKDKVKIKDHIYTPVNGVALKEGLFKTVFDNNRAFLKKLDMNAMLYWFEDKLGNEPEGEPYRGWFEDSLKGQTASLYLMGAGNVLRFAEDKELEEGVEKILNKIDESADQEYFIMPIQQEDFGNGEYPHYCRIWLNYGLAAAGMAGEERAYTMLRKWQDWFNHCDALPIIKNLHLSYQGIVASTYVYMLPVGCEEDYQVAQQYYEEDWRLAQFIRREKNAVANRNPQGDEPHAHGTELESFEGYLDLYRITGTKYYLDAVMGAWELYKRDWQHPGGGIVMCEFLEAFPGCGWINPGKGYNEFCCSAFWMNLNQRLHRLFPDEERFTAEIEKTIYNIAIANQDGENAIRYFAHLEGHKDPGGQVTCCCGVGTRFYGSIPEYLYSVSEDSIYLDIYAASSIAWERANSTVIVETVTDMPYENIVSVDIHTERKEKFTVALRMPDWMSKATEIKINGEMVSIGEPGTYQKLTREWEDGDQITFELPMTFRVKLYEGVEQIVGLNQIPALNFERYSFEYGPMLYAVQGKIDYNSSIWVRKKAFEVETWAIPTKQPLIFEVEGNPNQKLVPYFILGEDVTFTCFPVFAKPHFR